MSDVLCICGKYNRRGARFCGHCGRPIVVIPQSPFQTGLLNNGAVIANRYRITGKLGQGGMAAVYQVEDTRLRGKLCAIKEMSDASLIDPQERQRALADFEREALLLAHLSHPNLPRVTDSFEHQSKYYLVMDFVKGSTLEDLLVKRGHPFSEAEVRAWLHQLCNVLAYLHAYNPPIIFRDLKPSNIMLDNYGQIKLIDFGIARHFDAQKTHDTTALGTAGYAAPEQYGKDQSDARADIYALGATLHRLLTGHDPADTPFNLPPLQKYNPQVSDRLVKTIERCLQFDPQQRWQRVVDIQAAMGVVGAGGIAGGPVSTVAPTVAVQRSSRPTTRLVMAAAQLTAQQLAISLGAILLATIVGIWLLAPWVRTNLPFLWRTLPAFLLAGPTVYAATRRIGLAFIAHVAVTVVGWATIWARIGAENVDYTAFLFGVVLSGLVIEGGLALLYRATKTAANPNAWRRELLVYAGVTMLANLVFYFCWRVNALTREPVLWLVAALLGALGWFLGDLIKELIEQHTGTI